MRDKGKQPGFKPDFTRREFIQTASAFLITPLLDPLDHSLLTGKQEDKRTLIEGEFISFNPYQATVVEEVTSLIIPTDNSPGAREAGVVYEIDSRVADVEKEKKIYLIGIKWLDGMARNNFRKESFLDLSQANKISLLKTADAYKLPVMSEGAPAKLFAEEVIKLFFELIKQHTFEAFYTEKEGWGVAGYEGPPQWSGNRKYYDCS